MRTKLSKTKSRISKVIPFPLFRKPPRAPQGLGKSGRRLWKGIQAEYTIEEAGALAHLQAACRAEDDIQRMRVTVTNDGDVLLDRFQQKHPHPLLTAIRGLEAVRRQALRELNLGIEPLHDRPGRPPGK
jgi:hypothetical protein